MDPYYAVNRLNELQEDIDHLAVLLLNRFETPLTEKVLDELHLTLGNVSAVITTLRFSMNDPAVTSALAKK